MSNEQEQGPGGEGRLYRQYMTNRERAALDEAALVPGMVAEIEVARVALMRLLAEEGSKAVDVVRVAQGIARLIAAQHKLERELNRATELEDTVNRILEELGDEI